MSISRVKPANWGIGDKLTSAEQNQLDTNVTYAVDKRAGQTDTLGSVVTLSAAGRLIQAAAVGTDTNATITIGSSNLAIRVPSSLTEARTYTLSNTDAVAGDRISIFVDPLDLPAFNVTIKNAAGVTLATIGPTARSYWAEIKFISGAWSTFRTGGLDGGPLQSAFREEWGQLRALNFPQRASGPTASNEGIHYARFSNGRPSKWYICGSAESLYSSGDNGHTWTVDTALQAVAAGETFHRVASKSNGYLVVTAATAAGKLYIYNGSAWSALASAYAPGSLDVGQKKLIIYNPITDTWLFACSVSGAPVFSWSDDLATWHDGSIAALSTATAGMHAKVNTTSGRFIVAGIVSGATEVIFARSDDGGANWSTYADSAKVTPDLDASTNVFANLMYSEEEDCWYFVIHSLGATDYSSNIFRSDDDGLTWTLKKKLVSAILGHVACFDGLLVSVANVQGYGQQVVYSIDSGATWRLAGMQVDNGGNLRGAYAGGGRCVVLSDTYSYFGLAGGLPDIGLVT